MKNLINKIHLGDCLEFMKQLADKSIDLVLTDPPYGKGNVDYETSRRYGGWWQKYKNGEALKAVERTGGTWANKYKKRFVNGTKLRRKKSLTRYFE